jgi:hypothetical protein
LKPANRTSENASVPPASTASARPVRIRSAASPSAWAPAAQAVFTDRQGPRSMNAPLSASAMACGPISRSRSGSPGRPSRWDAYQRRALTSPALQVPTTVAQRSEGIAAAPAPESAIASSAARSAKSMAGSRTPSGRR